MTKILVETNDLRAGLISTVAHASNGKYYPSLARVRLDVGPVNINITATDTHTVGWAVVSVVSHVEPELETIDISVTDVEKILTVFKAVRTKGDEPEHTLCIATTEQEITITDASGLFAGEESLTVIRLPAEEKFPDIPASFAHAQHSRPRPIDWLLVGDSLVRKFHAAAACYHEPFTFETVRTSSSIIVRCGESFIGRMPQPELRPAVKEELARWRSGWDARIPTPAEVEAKQREQDTQK
ncbi:hypothetical protein FFI94_022105 [Rhodococcus sp. KBS0724]|uniref:hypothetical protein n=1 Tax=Rhodococcus sp. KBS0724 TaxID=1179674 RepID=UPI00110E4D29|nr:hypothetical protein [Rhodococcus sp. KBS0724]TSD48560.1 hypothetical protein FFI94_022105 [Rhodococcus sp. KBS0724]